MVYPIDFSKRIYCFITGASRGIGRTIAIELARKSTNKLTLVLLARSESGLSETKALIANVNKNVNIETRNLDLSEANASHFQQIIQETFTSEFDSALLFNNAGQIGNIKKAIDLSDKELWTKYYNLNVISVTVLNAMFLKCIQNKIDKIFIINITSLLGRKAFKYFSMYGPGKAARDHYFKILAKEEPNIVVLNYSPGMVDSSMLNELKANITNYEDSEIYANIKSNPSILTPEQTINKMFSLLEKAQFNSGDIIDYYD